jgi:hypothetical protein
MKLAGMSAVASIGLAAAILAGCGNGDLTAAGSNPSSSSSLSQATAAPTKSTSNSQSGSPNPLPRSTLPAGSITPDQDRQFFSQTVAHWSNFGLTPTPSETDLVNIGHSICSAWHNGATGAHVQQQLMDVPEIGPINGTQLVVSASQYLCFSDSPSDAEWNG